MLFLDYSDYGDFLDDYDDNGQVPPEKLQFSHEAVAEEIKKLEKTDIKLGIVECADAIICLEDEQFDLLKFTPEKISKLVSSEKKKSPFSPIEKSLTNNNNQFLTYVGQSITNEFLGKNYQAIPLQFCIYEESGIYPHRQNIPEENTSHFLILICPTNCEGGDVNFPDFKQKFSVDNGKMLTYAFCENVKCYEILKVTRGYRILVTYKIFENPLKIIIGGKKFVKDTEKLRELLGDIKEENTLIPVTKENIVQKICDEAKIKYKIVFAEYEYPKRVYGVVVKIEDSDMIEESYCNFHNLIEGSNYDIEYRVNLPDLPIINDSYEEFSVDYYAFLLLNPRKNKKKRDDDDDDDDDDDSK